jgi:hypothetical protein
MHARGITMAKKKQAKKKAKKATKKAATVVEAKPVDRRRPVPHSEPTPKKMHAQPVVDKKKRIPKGKECDLAKHHLKANR